MKRLHTGALICFAIAMGLYALSWIPGVFVLAFLGVVFEIAAWSQMLSADRSSQQASAQVEEESAPPSSAPPAP